MMHKTAGSQLSFFDDNGLIPSEFDSAVRSIEQDDQTYYSIVDICAVLLDRDYQTARKYWKNLKLDLKGQGANQLVTNPYQLKLRAADGRMRLTDVATREQVLRIVQSIPSPKAEPFKLWLAEQGEKSLRKQEDPDYAIDESAKELKQAASQLGHGADWIPDRLLGKEARTYLTAMISMHFDDQAVYGQTTNTTYKGLFGMDAAEIRRYLGLQRGQNTRNHMSALALTYIREAELICGKKLEDSAYITKTEFLRFVEVIASRIGAHIQDIQQITETDILTGRRQLTAAKRTYGEFYLPDGGDAA